MFSEEAGKGHEEVTGLHIATNKNPARVFKCGFWNPLPTSRITTNPGEDASRLLSAPSSLPSLWGLPQRPPLSTMRYDTHAGDV